VTWLTHGFDPPKPHAPLAYRDVALQQNRMRNEVNRIARKRFTTGIDTVRERRCPEAGRRHSVVGRGRGGALHVASRLWRELLFSTVQMAGGHLESPSSPRDERQPTGYGIEWAQIEVGAILVGLSFVEQRHLGLQPSIVQFGGDEAEGDVRRVEPMVSNGCDRIGERRDAMRKSCRTQRRLAGKASIDVPPQ
jgi:hypothetical protein